MKGLSREFTIWCINGTKEGTPWSCQQFLQLSFGENGTQEQALRDFKQCGWHVSSTGNHLCPNCKELRERKDDKES